MMTSCNDAQRQELVERLFAHLLEYITLPDNLDREALVSQDSGTIVLGLGCSSPKLFFNGMDWTGASLHWIWQPETQSFCLNFLAQQGTSTSTSNTEESSLDHILVPCTIDSFQWTLEASCRSSSKILTNTEATECRRVQLVEPIHTTGISAAHRSFTMSAIQTFWKFGKLQILCVEMEHVTLLGSFFSKAVQVPLEFNLEPDALFTCSKVALAAPGLPRTGPQHITLAKLVSMLTDWKTPNLQWKAPPVAHFESNTYHSLADVFRHVYNFLEDLETSTNKRGSQEQAAADATGSAKKHQQPSRGGLFGLRTMAGKSQEDSSQEGATTSSYSRRRLFGSKTMIEASSPATTATSTPSNSTSTRSTNATTPSKSTSTRSTTATTTTTTTTTTIKQSIGDSLAVTAGCVATGASFVTPIGVAVSVAAMGVKDGLVATATKGKSTRDGEHYQLGDLTRGVLTSMQEKRTQRKQRQDAARTMDDAFDAYSFNDTTTSTTTTTTSTNDASNTTNSSYINSNNNHEFVRTNSGRYASMVGSSAGAASDLSLVGGPIGLMAGSLVGGKATREAVRRTNSNTAAENCANNNDNDNDEEILRQLDQGQTQSQEQLLLEHMEADKPSFRLGDNLRGIVKRGKQSSGRDVDAPYQFADFSRGLFGRK